MLLSVMLGFIVAVLTLIAGKLLKSKVSFLLALLPGGLFFYYLSLAEKVAENGKAFFKYSWIPSLGVTLDFNLDGLSLLFCLLITGIGTLVFLYASSYLKSHQYLNRFFCYLSIFMASMLGLVLSDNLIALLVFWELTSISSFFLIGFDNENAESRRSSLVALAITGGGGFLLMAGFILIGNISGSYSIQEALTNRAVLQDHYLYWLMLLLVFAGSFTKSAQFPFHFWLPGAMKAPTPVSAYLHSATMVKAGIYLLARFTPVLGNNIYWNNILMIVGGTTMLYAAFHSIFRTDLKGILAYSTISALGIIVFLLGIGSQQALIAATVFILVHAFYKAGLFLVTGIIDYETGTRDVAKLGGLRKVMMPVAVAALLAAISSAGIPFTFGFLGKDLIYEGTLNSGSLSVWLTALAVITNILLLYAGFVAGIKPFVGRLPDFLTNADMPPLLMWLPPLLLGITSLFFGLFPAAIDKSLVQPVVLSMHGSAVDLPLKIWHGFNVVLLLSAITLVVGIILFFTMKPKEERLNFLKPFKVLSPQQLTEGFAYTVKTFAEWYTKVFQNGYLRAYVLIIVAFVITLLSYKLFSGVNIYLDRTKLHQLTIYELVVAGIMLVAIYKTITTSSRLIAVSFMGVIGYCICLLFVFYSAPDLAMTQFTIDTLTVVLFVLVLFRLPPFLRFTNTAVKVRDAVVALSFGTLLSIVALEVLNEPVSKETSNFYAENSYALAKGKNVVNVILVDFRGLDTLVEITVLTIAAIGVFSMLKLKIGAEEKE